VACSPPPEPEKPKGIVRIDTIPTELPIIVNGQPKGNSSSQGGQLFSISLEEGEYRIEVLKSIDEEKDLYGTKSILVAGDTLQTITIEAEERLTEFGLQEKTRREAEASRAAIEKERMDILEKQRKKEIAKQRHLKILTLNKPFTELLNNTPKITTGRRFKQTYSYKANGCQIEVSSAIDAGDGLNIRNIKVNTQYLDLKQSIEKRDMTGYYRGNGTQYDFVCKNDSYCFTYEFPHDGLGPHKMSRAEYIDTINNDMDVKPIVAAVEGIIRNCQ